MNRLWLCITFLIGSACAMDGAGSSTQTQRYLVDECTYNLNPDHAVTFVWRDGARRSLTAEQLIKLNAQFIWAKLRSEQENGFIHHDIIADGIISPTGFNFLCAFIDTYIGQELPTQWHFRPLPILSRDEYEKLVIACDFLQTNILTTLTDIKKYVLTTYSGDFVSTAAFGLDPHELQLLKALEPIDGPANAGYQDDYEGSPIHALADVLSPGARTSFRRIHGNNRWHYLADAQFSEDNQYVLTDERIAMHLWHVVPTVSRTWNTQQSDTQYLIYVPLEGPRRVWQLDDELEGLTLVQKIVIKQACMKGTGRLSPEHIRNLTPIYQSLPANIRQILPMTYQQYFAWKPWFTERMRELRRDIELLALKLRFLSQLR